MKLEIPNSQLELSEVERRARRIKLLLMDCDGVLTDGRIWLTNEGDEHKGFHTHDGFGISMIHRVGLKTGIISGRTSGAVDRRALELGMSYVVQDAKDKVAALEEIAKGAGVSVNECAFIGDDLADIPVMNNVELAIAVADAVTETKRAAHYITERKGGKGAVREVCELILRAQGLWGESKQ